MQKRNKVVGSMAEAVTDIPDGSSILFGGFGPGTPHNLVKALYEQGARGLTVILNSAGGGGGGLRTGNISISNLIEDRRVRKVIMAFTASTHPSRKSVIEELEEAGELEAELVPQGTLAERIRAGGVGIPAFYTPAAIGTQLAEGRETRFFNGREYLLEEAITADYAFVRAWHADEFGNLQFRGSERNFNPIMATAARTTIVETEQIGPIGSMQPEQIHTSGIFVHRLVQIPPDGIFHVASPAAAAANPPATSGAPR
ncbi:MAG TPA: CoA transferase subunit A [Dehalococcoidia bacterium]|nr:CoA transferase subunit A [Dehalococcoidia bacterium]